ncbi:UvrD-helicase domain-containing protein [Niveibacterium sp. SC-1]|uniref:UvrD-helicase domain-containing protein n=1 Tax=Niveibacterium sp. SC-1 TaxID=3135646 RepID=UPI00311E4757
MTLNLEFVSAGAGSGKTHTLTERLYEALTKDGVSPAGVVATTFTRKAAAELRERVRDGLLARGHLELAIAMDTARIGTVNSVCGDLVERFALVLGLPAKLDVVEEADATQLLRETLDGVLDADCLTAFEHLARRLSIEDWATEVRAVMNAVRANNMPIASLQDMAKSSCEALLAYWPPAAQESPDAALLEAIEHALAAAESAQQKKHTDTTEKYVNLLATAARDLTHGGCAWANWVKLSKATAAVSLRAHVDAVQDAARRYEQHPRLREDLTRWIELVFDVAARALQTYAEVKRQRRVIDFVDQERLLLEALDRPEVAEVLRDELDLLLVDEFQDTSPIQLALFVRLAALARRTIWVGDIKQAIYGFRGSDVALMQAVLAALPALGATQTTLPHSYRSRPELVALVNEAFVPAFAEALEPAQIALNPARKAVLDNEAYEWWALAGKNQGDIAASLAAGVADLLRRAPQIECRTTKELRPLGAGDVAILARTNDGVARAAEALAARGIPVAFERAGLLASPEGCLVRACLRRLEDPSDTLASAEIITLTECRSAEVLLADRMKYLADEPHDARRWRESGDGAHPVLAQLAALRGELRLTRAPSEILCAVIAQCDLARYTQQWGPDARADARRLSNLDALAELATRYEQSCRGRRITATLQGMLLHFDDLAEEGEDAQAMSDADAVRVLTHHAAKGLEWPAVIALDLEVPPRACAWGLSVRSHQPMSLATPLAGRTLRYWRWPFGPQRADIPVADKIDADCGTSERVAAEAEARRLLYVSMTRARDLLVFAIPAKTKGTPWLDLIGAPWLKPQGGALTLPGGGQRSIVSAVREFDANGDHPTTDPLPSGDASWFAAPPQNTSRPAAFISPSTLTEEANPASSCIIKRYGAGFAVRGTPDMARVGEALHACLAATTINPTPMADVARVAELLGAWQVGAHVDAQTVASACTAFSRALTDHWPATSVSVEIPLQSCLANGQVLNGRIDMLLDTAEGWRLIDHKSNRVGEEDFEAQAREYSGQLEAYAHAIERATGRPVVETAIHFFTAQTLVVFDRAAAASPC